jgi:DNA repair protein RecN (Recombination protein N)
MLQKLVIRNYAIIDNLALTPDAHLNTVTGETGAGKSIILGALSLILGERADTSVLINKEEKCVVEAHFDVAHNATFREALCTHELDDEAHCIIRREINTSGKTRAFINDTPVNLSILNKLTSLLVDLHQQFDHMALQDGPFQLNVLDALAKNAALQNAYKEAFEQYRKTTTKLASLRDQQSQWQREADYKQFLLDELTNAGFKENEVEDAAAQLKSLTHAERILGILQAARFALDEGEQPMVNELKKICQQLSSLSDLLPQSLLVQERMASAYAELKDLVSEIEGLESSVSLDTGLMQELQERMDLGYRLFKKHGVADTAELLALQVRLETELQASLNLSETIAQLQQEQGQLLKDTIQVGGEISERRKEVAPGIAEEVTRLLGLVGMPNARFNIVIKPLAQPQLSGMDEVHFQLDANKSGQFQPLHKAASGGEMSRIMLSIKSLTAQAMELPTLIFDEVDTGISGEAARQVGLLLRDLARYHQVICITHQPQVAARGSRHFYVYKDADGRQRITTKVRELQPEERVMAIARMIGGEQPSEAALQNARELVEL